MFGIHFVSLIEGAELQELKADYKKAKTIGKYKVSPNAIYRPDGKYLPKSAISSVVQDKGSVHVTGCCIGVVPTDRLVIVAADKPYQFDFDSVKQVQKAREILEL